MSHFQQSENVLNLLLAANSVEYEALDYMCSYLLLFIAQDFSRRPVYRRKYEKFEDYGGWGWSYYP